MECLKNESDSYDLEKEKGKQYLHEGPRFRKMLQNSETATHTNYTQHLSASKAISNVTDSEAFPDFPGKGRSSLPIRAWHEKIR